MTIYGMCEHYDCSLRNNAGYCQATVCMNSKYNGWGDKETVINNGRNVNPDEIKAAVEQYRTQHMTNADRIRSMTDEELAEWLANEKNCSWNDGFYGSEGASENDLLAWLKSPVEEVDNG